MPGEMSVSSKKKKGLTEGAKKTNKAKQKTTSSKAKVPPPLLKGEPGSKHKKQDAVAELKQLFVEMDLPDRIVPNNVKSFHYNRSSGELRIELHSGFEKAFDKDNVIKFESHVEGRLKHGVFDRIKGVTRGSASIVSIERGKPGHVDITGKLGFFHKTMTFADSAIPDMP